MRFTLLYGPNRIPIGQGLESESGCVPFHQVISRGLLQSAEDRGLAAEDWQAVAPFVDRALCGSGDTQDQLGVWFDLARQNLVLSYESSARCAMEFISGNSSQLYQQLAGKTIEPGSIRLCELWGIKEGHTSSIWIVTLHLAQTHPSARFVVNVARDMEAGEELTAMDTELSALHLRDHLSAVKVLGSGTVADEWDVPVLATSWIPNGLELHVLPSGRAVAIDRFNPDPSDPRRVASVTVRSDLDSDELWGAILRSWVALGNWSQPDGPVRLPRTEINEGDWVYSDGRAVLCGLTPGEFIMSPAEALDACFSLRATLGHRGATVEWSNREAILAILCEAAVVKRYPALARALRTMH